MNKSNLICFFLSLISSILFFLSFPKFGSSIFGWFCLVPLIIVVFYIYHYSNFHYKPKKVIIFSIISGLIGYCGILYWIIPTFIVAGESLVWGVVAMLLLALYCSLYFALFFLYVYYAQRLKSFFYVLTSSSLWVLLEYIRGHLFSGFPWMLLGYSQYENLSIIQVAEYVGVYGVSFVLVFFNTFLAKVIYDFVVDKKVEKFVFNIFILMLLPICISLYGKLKINKILKKIENASQTLTVVILQGNIDQYKKWDKQYVDYIMNTYSQLVFSSYQEILKKGTNNLVLYIWPESSVPGWVLEEDYLYNWISSLVKLTNSTKEVITFHLVGSVRMDKNKKNYYNSALLFKYNSDKKDIVVDEIYDKIHLVPFGEYVPFRNILGKFIKTVNELGEFSSGKEYKVFYIDGIKFSSLICYESIFPELTRRFTLEGAEFLVNITNDAWFLKTSAPYQHFIFNIFRAVENRCFLLRAANTGISSIIYPTGEVIKATELFKTTNIVYSFNIYNEKTFYVKYGGLLWVIYFILFLLFNLIKQK
ncbi:MAG: apolipoprotein N-acyltransferase [Endomicrobia bacterium]|nr:apolipoprotein N-acyltransferase [Endomicrobiia bacterium]